MSKYQNRGSLVYQIKNELDKKLAIGTSRHDLKKIDKNAAYEKITSWGSYKNIMQKSNVFARFCKDNYGCKTLDDCRPYVNVFLASHENAHTAKGYANALGNLYSVPSTDFIKTPERTAPTKGREQSKRDASVDREANKDLIDFVRGSGLRRHELENLKTGKIDFKDGQPYVVVEGGKGGKPRIAPILGTPEQQNAIVAKIEGNPGQEKVWEQVHTKLNVQSLRRNYCQNLYRQYARDLSQLHYKEKYFCRGENVGKVYDKAALKICSEALGHNRLDVVVNNYFR